MLGTRHPPLPSTQQKVWCECRLRLHRGSAHYITRKQKKRHLEACREQRIPFTDEEASTARESIQDESLHAGDSTLTDEESSSNDVYLRLQIVEPGSDEEDQPDISDWIEDTAAASGEEGSDVYIQSLDMLDAFRGTPRGQLQRIRNVLTTYYGADIGDPIRTGQRILNEVVGDLIQPQFLDCCADGCVAYTGRLLTASACPVCSKRRYNEDRQSMYAFQYLPLMPRLRLQYSHPARSSELSSYRATFDPSQPDDGTRGDIFDGCWFRECWADGYFQDHRDLAMRLTIDAISTVKNPKKRQSITPVVIYLLNLHPTLRDNASNTLTTHIIPGGFDKDYVDTWLYPLITELNQLREGVDAYDGASNQDFTLKAHVILVTGDGPAVADVMGTKHPGKAKQSCRMCTFSGTLGRGGKYFYPHAEDTVDPINIHLREQIEEIDQLGRNNVTRRDLEQRKRDLGINCRSILVDIPTLHFPRSFPIDTMHSMNHNIPKSLFHLWKGSKYPRRGGTVAQYPWVLPNTNWVLIDHSILASRATVPTYVGTAPRSTSSFGNWNTYEWRSFFLTYGAPAMHHYLPKQYGMNFLRYRQLLQYTSQQHFTSSDVTELHARAQTFLREYEDLYYGGDQDLLPSCTIQLHYLHHLSQNIQDFGPPSCYAQWSLERFLRTIKIFATSTLYKHRSAEINTLIREQRIHAKWSTTTPSVGNATASADEPPAPSSHELIRYTSTSMSPRWQRELRRSDDPSAPWYTGTVPQDLLMYQNLLLPTGARVGIFDKRLQRLASRSNAFVMFYADLPTTQMRTHRERKTISFGTVVALFIDPANLSQWAGIVRYRKVQLPSTTVPRPRMFDEEANDMIWISANQVLDLVGVAQVYYYDNETRGISKLLFLVDKHGFSEAP
jgi:hypothetical protein